MHKSDYRTENTGKKRIPNYQNKAHELLSDSSMELSPEKSAFYKKNKAQQSHKNTKSINFENEERVMSKGTVRTYTRGYSGAELESDSIYKGKTLGFEPKELSGGEGTSQRHESTIIDQEVKGKLRKSLALPRKKMHPNENVKSSLALSEDRKDFNMYDQDTNKYLSSGDYTDLISKHRPKASINKFENIDEESAETGTQKSIAIRYSHQENELREAFIENLREMVTGVFRDLKHELQDSSEKQLQKIMKDKERVAVLKETINKDDRVSETTREILKIQDQMMIGLGNLLGTQLRQNNKVKGMLIDTLMFLDKQVLEVSKIRRMINQQKNSPRTDETDSQTKKLIESQKSDDMGLDMENVTDSWVDRHSLLPKEMQATLNQERVKLESPTENPLINFPSIDTFKKEQPQYMKSMNPLRWMSKIFKTGSEKQKFLNRKRGDKLIKKRAEKDNNCVSARNYPVKNEIRYNSSSYQFEKKSIFSMPHLGLFAEKYKLKSKNYKNKLRGGYLKNRKTKNFVKKNKEFKDEISGKDEKKRLKEELVKGKTKESIKAVQSMCTSAIQNITDSKILIVKTRSGKEIKNKTCLDEVKHILKGFRKDLQTKQSRMRENNEDILELQSSVRRLESDIKQAKRESGKAVDTRAKKEEIRQKTIQIKNLEDTNKALSSDMKTLTKQIEELKRQNENNLKEVTKVVKRKFREIESRNKHERQVQKDIILKYNVELESKNTEINELIGRYQELRLLNEDLSKEIIMVKKKKKRSKSNNLGKYTSKYNSRINLNRKKSRSRLKEDQLMKRTDISQSAILKSVSEFEDSLNDLDSELQKEEERLGVLSRAKEKSKKQLYDLEKAYKKKNKEVQQSRGRADLKNQLIQLNVNKSNKAKSLEAKHRMLKMRKEALSRLMKAANNVRITGKKVIKGTTEQLRSILLSRDEIKKKDKLVEDQLKKEKYLYRVNELKEEKLKAKNSTIEKMNFKINQLQNQVFESKKFKIIRDKSSNSRKEFPMRKTKKNASTNNLEILTRKKNKLYHNSNKTGSHTNFYNNMNNKFMSQTLNSMKNTSRKAGKSSTINRRKKKSKTPNKEELSEKYAMMIKNNYKNVLNDLKIAKKSFHSKRMSKSGLRQTTKKKESHVPRHKYDKMEKELEELKSKYHHLEQKYMETHNDLLRSNNSIKVEALRIKKQSERSLKQSLGGMYDSKQFESERRTVQTQDKCVGISSNLPLDINIPKYVLRSLNTSVSNDQTQIPNLNISELHNLAIEEVYATNSSFIKDAIQGNSKELVKENKKMKNLVRSTAKRLKKMVENKIGEKIEKVTNKYTKKILQVENKVERLKRTLEKDKLKESLNLLEMTLGDDVMDAEKKKLMTKLNHIKEDLEIEQKNNINLRSQILEKEEKIKELVKEVEEAKAVDKKQVTDKDLIQRNLDLEDKVKELEKKKADVDVQIGQIRQRYKFSYKKMNEMKAEQEDIEKNMDALSQTVENQRKELKDKDEEIEKIKKEKGRDTKAEKSTDEYIKDLATGNKENERLNSLLDEERLKVEGLEREILKLNDDVNMAKQREEELKIKINVFSQTLKNNEETKHLIDAVVDDPKVTEFGTQGGIKSFSFKDIFKDFQHKLAQAKSKTEKDNKDALDHQEIKKIEHEKEKEKIQEPVQIPKNAIANPEPLKQDNVAKEGDKNMTFNINNITITHISVISPTSKAKQKDNQIEFAPQRASKSLESNKISSKKVDFKSKLSTSFDLKSLDDISDSDKKQPELIISDKKSSFNKMYLPDDMTDSDSSITSLIQNPSPRNSKGENLIFKMKENDIGKDSHKDSKNGFMNDLTTVKKNQNKSSGNMIIKNSRVSVNSVNENFNVSPRGKPLHKSLFALKTEEDVETKGIETLAKGDSSFNFEDNDDKSSELNKSDSFDDMMFGGKKEINEDVFYEENNAFEQDNLMVDMLKDDTVEVGTSAIEYSQRIIARNNEEAKTNRDNPKNKVKPKVNEKKNNLLEPPKEEKKTIFDESFRNESFAFASNPREQSLLMAPANILNTNLSFAAVDKNGFISGTSFGTNNEINNVLDCIKEHSIREEQKKKEQKKPNVNNLVTVPEEANIAEDFQFKLPNQSPKGSRCFDSTNSLTGLGDFLTKPKQQNQNGNGNDQNMLDILAGFNTDALDQKCYDNILGKKVSQIDIDGSISPSMQSPSGSTDGMFFGTKCIQEDSDED